MYSMPLPTIYNLFGLSRLPLGWKRREIMRALTIRSCPTPSCLILGSRVGMHISPLNELHSARPQNGLSACLYRRCKIWQNESHLAEWVIYRYETICVPDAIAEMVVNTWMIGCGLLPRYPSNLTPVPLSTMLKRLSQWRTLLVTRWIAFWQAAERPVRISI